MDFNNCFHLKLGHGSLQLQYCKRRLPKYTCNDVNSTHFYEYSDMFRPFCTLVREHTRKSCGRICEVHGSLLNTG